MRVEKVWNGYGKNRGRGHKSFLLITLPKVDSLKRGILRNKA